MKARRPGSKAGGGSVQRSYGAAPGKGRPSDRVYGPAVQRAAARPPQETEAQVVSSADRGLSGGSGQVPYQGEMERSFGVSFAEVESHAGPQAQDACAEIGANAYARGNQVAFASDSPDRGLVAHELTHVVQQSGEARPKMAVGAPGDAYEQEADQVAARVSAGESVRDVAARHMGSEPVVDAGSGSAVQGDFLSDLGLGATNLFHDVAEVVGLETPDEAEAARLAAFQAHGVFGPEDLVPPTNIGGFAASYDPGSGELTIQVRTGIDFNNGLGIDLMAGTITANHPDLTAAATAANGIPDLLQKIAFVADFIWTASAQADFIADLKTRVEGAWNSAGSGLSFTCTKPGWEAVTASVNVDIDVHEGAASGTDHLQASVWKVPDSGQYTIGSAVDGDRDDPNNAFDNDPHNNGVEMSSTDVAETPQDLSLLQKSVQFGHDSAALTPASQATLAGFAADFQDANLDNSNPVELVGRASSSGSASYNEQLAQRRTEAVKAHLQSIGFTGIDTRVTTRNEGDAGADEDPDWRRVDLIVGSGEGQLVAAHEFGHVFGVLDEYAINPGGGISGTGNPTGTVVGHDAMAQAIGTTGAVAENNDGIMSLGNAVRPQHYATFGWALGQVTRMDKWRVG